jgi:hypothetical protein
MSGAQVPHRVKTLALSSRRGTIPGNETAIFVSSVLDRRVLPAPFRPRVTKMHFLSSLKDALRRSQHRIPGLARIRSLLPGRKRWEPWVRVHARRGDGPSADASRSATDRSSDREVQETVRAFMSALSGARGELAWQAFREQLVAQYDSFSTELGRHLKGDELVHMLSLFLLTIARTGFVSEEVYLKLFDAAEAFGLHILPANYDYPIPNTSLLPDGAPQRRLDSPGLDLDVDAQLCLMDKLSRWAPEMADIPTDRGTARPEEYSWHNPMFDGGDAVVYYCMIREFKPRRILEVGSGYSTLVAAKAARKNGGATVIDCIEPYPMEILKRGFDGLRRLLISPVQEVALHEFESLEPNDVLFVDSSHVSSFGSDVNHIFFNMLPRLQAGVLVHFHDIFLPWDYPNTWIKQKKKCWNEAYLLLAFLLFNPAWNVLLANYFLASEFKARWQAAFPTSPVTGGGSFWVRAGMLPHARRVPS